VGLSDDDRRTFAEQFLEELEAEHVRREHHAIDRKRRRSARSRGQTQREHDINTLRDEVRTKYYDERGYQQQVDQTGRTVWLSPAEQELHQSRRRRRHRLKGHLPKTPTQIREVILFGVMCAVAVIIGLMLAH